MGTEITLSFGGLDIDWSKNSRGADHGMLFQEEDCRPVRSEQIDYDYFKASGEDPINMEMAFARKLKDVVPRLELLGFTLDQARAAYDDWAETWREEAESSRFADPDHPPNPLTFEEYCAFLNRQPVADLDDTFIALADRGEEQRKIKGRFAEDEALIARIPREIHGSNPAYSERSFFGHAVLTLNPYLTLRLLAENPTNCETDVVWQYGPLVVGGYASVGEFVPAARRTETFLIVTEGSSDAHILKHALSLLRPEILDFFRFIDVSERHPFAGTGNLVKFAEGLAKIDVQNQILFVFDNDAEGVDAFRKVRALSLPENMRAMLLPDLDAFRHFPTRGPEGEHLADINGRAAAIECYLDHQLRDFPAPQVVWTNYKKEMDTYQGALEHKESYTRAFMDLRAHALGDYATDKIARVLDALIAQCVAIAQDAVARHFDDGSD